MLLSVACGMQSRYTARPRGFLLPRALATTPGINRRPNAGGGIDCAEGDSGPPGNGCEPSWARPCEASGALLLSNGGSGGGHAACTLWPPPAPFGYFPARGKYLVRPQAGETSHKKHIPCGGQGKRALLFFCYLGDFASAEATKGLSGRPLETFGADVRNLPQITDSLWKAGGKERCSFFLFRRGFRLCGGDQRAFRSPFGNLRRRCTKSATNNRFLMEGRGKERCSFFLFRRRFRLCGGDQRAFRSPFGNLRRRCTKSATNNRFLMEGRGKERCSFFLFRKRFRLCGGDQRAFRSPFGNLRVNMLWRST